MKCESCKKELTEDMEIEYSKDQTCYFCNFTCAENWAFEFLSIAPIFRPITQEDKEVLFPELEQSEPLTPELVQSELDKDYTCMKCQGEDVSRHGLYCKYRETNNKGGGKF